MDKNFGRSLRFIKKLKFVDYLIIVIVLLAAVLFYKFIHHEQKWINTTAISYATVFQANSLRTGDYEVDSSGKKIAVINNFEIVDTPALVGNPFLNKILVLNVAMLVDTSTKSDQIQYKNQPLAVGTQIDFNFSSTSLQTYISDMTGDTAPSKYLTKNLTVIIYNQWPWFADAINVGDSQTGADGKKTIEVISKEVNPTQVVNTTATGEVMELIGSSKVDIKLKLKTKLQKVNNYYIFEGYNNIFIGKPITFTLGKIQVNSAAVTNIE